ncbi:hypothetical protein BDZ97DRAFT_1966827 [Flammula alnicola]|nr:hypothetical protein BDZ97DRAFT_1966827 [Flammula alnicola]
MTPQKLTRPSRLFVRKMLIVKIPLLVINAYMSNKSMTPPTPPPAPNEFATESERRSATFWKYAMMVENMIYSTMCLMECAMILALHYQSHDVSQAILSLLKSSSDGTVAALDLQFTSIFFIGSMLSICGALIRLYCFNELGRLFTFYVCIRKDHELITTGPYAYVRHPSYTGYIMNILGRSLCHLTHGSLLVECGPRMYVKEVMTIWFLIQVVQCFICIVRSGKEDNSLRKLFGKQWDAWAAKVRYRIVPGIF